jgi:MHS family citrate/tricarballylate:H+ symporter-like MFS transporter
MTISTYVVTYMTTYGQTALDMSPRTAMLAPITNGLVSVPVSMWGGTLCDRFGRKRVMIVSCALAAVLSIPSFMFLVYARTAQAMIIVVAVQTAAAVPGRVAGVTVMTEVFPQQLRGVAVSFAYAMTVTLFGSTTQFVVAALIGATGSPMTPSFYLVATTAVSLVAMVLLPETSPDHRAAAQAGQAGQD